jgi:predicted ATP-grasp superfamily ATP-dependent carboligase/protein tyrosine phosphatase (PTP) superfamily phosphohydrolase (DUF442 family)
MKDRTVRVLVTDGCYKHTLGAVRTLARAGFQTDAIGSRSCLCRWSRHLSQIAYPQDQFTEYYMPNFVNFLKNSRYDVLLPMGARSVRLVSRHRQDIAKHCAIPLASPEVIELCLKKDETYRFAAKLDVKVPKTWAFTCLSELKSCIPEIVFPVVVKGRNEIEKEPPFYAQNEEQLFDIIEARGRGKLSKVEGFPLVQQYINGVGVGFFALYQKGHCKRVFMHRRLRETPQSGGPSCCAESIYEPDLLATGKKLLDTLAWHGVAMVEFKREKDTDKLYLMEINPKFWGSLDLALASGVDFPVLDIRMALGEDIPYSEDYKVGLKFHWPLDGEISHIKENPKALFSVLWDCIDPHTKSNLHIDDPLPAIYSLYSKLRSLGGLIPNISGMRKILHRTRSHGLRAAFIQTLSNITGIPAIRYSQITPQIYIGAQHSTIGKRRLKRLGITGIVNMRSELDDKGYNLVLGNYCHLPTVEFTAPTMQHLYQGVRFIQRMVDENRKVYIHCSEGTSRAPTMAAAYLISRGMKLSDAIAFIKRSRPFINILPLQMERLFEFSIYAKENVTNYNRI